MTSPQFNYLPEGLQVRESTADYRGGIDGLMGRGG
jgi:hypothetical protein